MKVVLSSILFFFGLSAMAQNLKTDVLVVGANAGGVAAAIQSARSGVKTLLIAESSMLGQDITSASPAFRGGLYEEFINRVHAVKKDSTALTDPATTASVLKAMTDTIKNLSVRYNSGWQEIKRSGKNWEVKLKEPKSSVKSTVVVDATLNEFLSSSAGVPLDPKSKMHKTVQPALFLTDLYNSLIFRTSIGVGTDPKTGMPYVIPLGALFASGAENFFVIGKLAASQLSPDAMYTGQAAGATASFFAFFDESTRNISQNMRTRMIQAELQKYKAWLFPFTDVGAHDRDAVTLEHIALTGILKTEKKGNELKFNPDSAVIASEISKPLKEYYSRSQIWFINNKDVQKLTVDNMLSLVKYIGNRGNELNKEVEAGWERSFHFTGKFDLQRVLTRREFSILLDRYLQPFSVRVNLSGNLGS